jgi:hypothetical protein
VEEEWLSRLGASVECGTSDSPVARIRECDPEDGHGLLWGRNTVR